MTDEIHTSFLLSEEETVEMNRVFAIDNRRWEYTLFCCVLGLFLIIPSLIDLLNGKVTLINLLYITAGVFIVLFYDIFSLRILTVRRARKNYDTHVNHKLSTSLYAGCEKFSIESDKYRLSVRPQELWKCIESSGIFLVYAGSERCFAIPKRALSAPEIDMLRDILQKSLPQGQYGKTGR